MFLLFSYSAHRLLRDKPSASGVSCASGYIAIGSTVAGSRQQPLLFRPTSETRKLAREIQMLSYGIWFCVEQHGGNSRCHSLLRLSLLLPLLLLLEYYITILFFFTTNLSVPASISELSISSLKAAGEGHNRYWMTLWKNSSLFISFPSRPFFWLTRSLWLWRNWFLAAFYLLISFSLFFSFFSFTPLKRNVLSITSLKQQQQQHTRNRFVVVQSDQRRETTLSNGQPPRMLLLRRPFQSDYKSNRWGNKLSFVYSTATMS